MMIMVIITIKIGYTRKNILWSTQAKKFGEIRYNENINYLSDIVALCNIFTLEEIRIGWQHS